MKTVEIIIPTLRKIHAFTCFESLRYVPWPYKVHVITKGKTWAEAINIGLKQTNPENDVILMDDDVFLKPETFFTLDVNYEKADIFGFKLLFPDGLVQHFGGFVNKEKQIGHIGWMRPDAKEYSEPIYVCHATTSLVYIKRSVLDVLVGMAEDIPGVQCEDIDFSFRALKAGKKIMVLPDSAYHVQSASKKFMPQFNDKVALAFNEIRNRHLENKEFLDLACSYPKPILKLAVA